VTVVDPLILTTGTALPELWHMVQVEPFFPETPEIPPPYALAEDGKQIMTARTAMNETTIEDCLNFNLVSPWPECKLCGLPSSSDLSQRLLLPPSALTSNLRSRCFRRTGEITPGKVGSLLFTGTDKGHSTRGPAPADHSCQLE